MSKSLGKMDSSKQCHIAGEMSFDDVNQFREIIARMWSFLLTPGAHRDEMKELWAQVMETKKGG